MFDEHFETWRDALRQSAVHGESRGLRAAASRALDCHVMGTVHAVLASADGSIHLPKLQAALVNVWVPS